MDPINYETVAKLYPHAWDALPECYKADSCLTFFLDCNGNLCSELDLGGECVWNGSKWVSTDPWFRNLVSGVCNAIGV